MSESAQPAEQELPPQPTEDSEQRTGEDEDQFPDDEFAEFASFDLKKALPSELTPEESYKLLLDISKRDSSYYQFQKHDLKLLTQVLSILAFKDGDKIIAQGEEATFCGIALKGTFTAIVSPTLQVPLTAGALVGEMSLFEGGMRNADIIAGADSVLGVMTFEELENLGIEAPQLQRKLIFLFAVASIKKLRRMTTQPTSPLSPTSTTLMENRGLTPAPPPPAPTPMPSIVGGVKARTENIKREFLYRAKAAQAEKLQQTALDLEKEKLKRAKAEKAQRTDKFKLDNALRRLEIAQGRIEELETNAETNEQAAISAQTKATSLLKELETIKGELNKTSILLDEERKTSQLLMGANSTTGGGTGTTNTPSSSPPGTASATGPSGGAGGAKLRKLQSEHETMLKEMERLRAALAQQQQQSQEQAQEHQKLKDKSTKLQSDLSANILNYNNSQKEIVEARSRAQTMLRQAQDKERLIGELRHALRALETRYNEVEERYIQLQPWKSKALELQTSTEMEKKRHARSIEDLQRAKQDLEDDVGRYSKILKFVTVGAYARDFRLRRALAMVHEHVTDLLLSTMEETMSANNKVAKTSIKTIKKRKRAYLATLLKAKSRARDLVQSLDDEVLKLRAPMDEILERAKHWKATAESFFQRNIQLTNEREELERQYRKTITKLEALKQLIKQQTNEYEELHSKNAELNGKVHVLKSELDRASVPALRAGGAGGAAATQQGDEQAQQALYAIHMQIAEAEQYLSQLQLQTASSSGHHNNIQIQDEEKMGMGITGGMNSTFGSSGSIGIGDGTGGGGGWDSPASRRSRARIRTPVHTLHSAGLRASNPYLKNEAAEAAKKREEAIVNAHRERIERAMVGRRGGVGGPGITQDPLSPSEQSMQRIESQYLFNLPPVPPLHSLLQPVHNTVQPIPLIDGGSARGISLQPQRSVQPLIQTQRQVR